MEYEIDWGGQKIRVKQRWEQGGGFSTGVTNPSGKGVLLGPSFVESKAAAMGQAAPARRPGPGGNGVSGTPNAGGDLPPGSGPVTFIGPFVMICPCEECGRAHHGKPHEEKPQKG